MLAEALKVHVVCMMHAEVAFAVSSSIVSRLVELNDYTCKWARPGQAIWSNASRTVRWCCYSGVMSDVLHCAHLSTPDLLHAQPVAVKL
jgi:hypothetical protein